MLPLLRFISTSRRFFLLDIFWLPKSLPLNFRLIDEEN